MECKKGAAAMLQWRSRYLTDEVLDEAAYDQALRSAEALEHSGAINASEWIELVRQANAALLRVR